MELCIPVLEPEEERVLLDAVRAGDRSALERLVRANRPYVLRLARAYRGRGVAFEDLVAEGNLGLLEAAPRYAPARGTRFLTYATWWIRKRMLAALDGQARTVRVPGRFWPSRWKGGMRPPPAVDLPLHGLEGAPVVERLRDPAALHAEQDLLHRESLSRMQAAVARLSAQERCVLDHRFGLQGDAPRTLQETGVHLRISRERVRQVEQQAIARLKRALDPRYPRRHVRPLAPAPARPPAPELPV